MKKYVKRLWDIGFNKNFLVKQRDLYLEFKYLSSFLVVILFGLINGCSLYMFGAHSIEMLSRMESDRFIKVDIQIQLDQQTLDIQKYFRCVQSFNSDAGAGVTERWDPLPLYATIESKTGEYWFIDAPSCKKNDLIQYPHYIAHFSNDYDLHPKIYEISEAGPFKRVCN